MRGGLHERIGMGRIECCASDAFFAPQWVNSTHNTATVPSTFSYHHMHSIRNQSLLLAIVLSYSIYGLAFRFTTHSTSTPLHSTSNNGNKEEQVVQDLNLEEMFEVFDAADKDKALKMTPKPGNRAKKNSKEVSVRFDPAKSVGVELPMGFFDPALFTQDVSEEQFNMYQESEFKHGRVAMLAFVGILYGELGPGLLFQGKVTGPAIFQFQQAEALLPQLPLIVLTLIGMIEVRSILRDWQPLEETMREPLGLAKLKKSHTPGDLGFDPLRFTPPQTAALRGQRTKELNNGRLAMLAVAGIVAQELVTRASVF